MVRKRLPGSVVLDLATLLAYLFAGDKLHEPAIRLFEEIERNGVKTYISEVVPYEAETLSITGNIPAHASAWSSFVSRLWQDPLFPRLPMTAKVFAEHLHFYRRTGGRFTYFDSYHLAASKVTGMPIVTSDKEILSDDSVSSIDLAEF
jgi:predicted nucleic acid-binding protein